LECKAGRRATNSGALQPIAERTPPDEASLLIALAAGIPLTMVAIVACIDELFLPLIIYVALVLPFLAIVWAIAAVRAGIWAIRYARNKAWRKSILAAAFPLLLMLVASDPLRFTGFTQYAGDVLHFAAVKPGYDREIARLPSAQSRWREFNWGGMLFASRGVLYDESDEVALPAGRQSQAWLARARDTDLMCGGSAVPRVQALWGHYFIAGFGC
jgi:hypothetical protein